jgi:hypothetical protein
MGIQRITIFLIVGYIALLLVTCIKRIDEGCAKDGYEYINETSSCWYTPGLDSVRVGDTITLEAAIPKSFIDPRTTTIVTNSAKLVEGPFGIGMIYPIYQAAADSFALTSQIGNILKDTIHFPETQLKGFRTIQWDGTAADSFRMKILIRPLAKGIYSFALNQQSAKDKDCALYKYFLKPGNDQHLYYWMNVFGNVSVQVAFFGYCFKVY